MYYVEVTCRSMAKWHGPSSSHQNLLSGSLIACMHSGTRFLFCTRNLESFDSDAPFVSGCQDPLHCVHSYLVKIKPNVAAVG